ncbi:MAG: H-NS histone family protein [Pseudomonadota bacterium]
MKKNKSSVSVADMSIDEMLDLKDAIDQRLAVVAHSELETLERRLERLSDFAKMSPPPKLTRAKKTEKAAKPAARRTSKLKGVKAPAKFRDPKTGNSWSGRGLTPLWLREYESNGGNRSDLAV